MNALDQETIAALRDFSKGLYDTLDDAHGVEHGARVVRLAALIQSREGGDPSIVEAGGWLHQFHDNLDELSEGLTAIRLDDATRRALFHVVEVCRPKKIHRADSIEAKIVYDADALEVLGPHGAVREVYCNTRFRGLAVAKAVASTIEVQELFVSTMQTETGRLLCDSAQAVANDFWGSYRQWEDLSPSLLDPE